MTYESETWTLTKSQERKLRGAQRGMEKLMLKIPTMNKKTANE